MQDGVQVVELGQAPRSALPSADDVKARRLAEQQQKQRAAQQQKQALLAELACSGHASLQAGELSRQLLADAYDCSICTKLLRRREPIWSCQRCYVMLHQNCVNRWYQTKVQGQGLHIAIRHSFPPSYSWLVSWLLSCCAEKANDEKASWSCPLCNLMHDEPPKPYQSFPSLCLLATRLTPLLSLSSVCVYVVQIHVFLWQSVRSSKQPVPRASLLWL
jgi:hypothetical protein